MFWNPIAYQQLSKIYNVHQLSKKSLKKLRTKDTQAEWLKSGSMILIFEPKSGCRMPLSKVYVALQNPFYYGEFQYGDKWYKGTHKPLISKTLFEKVQIQLQVAPKQWNKQLFSIQKDL